MNLRPLIFDEDSLEKLSSLKKFAEENVLDYRKPPQFIPGDTPQYTRIIPVDYKVVFTHSITFEVNSMELVKVRILSISVPAVGKLPNVAPVFSIAEQLGFDMDSNGGILETAQFDFEDISPKRSAIRISQIIEEYEKE